MVKTNAMRLLSSAKISFETREYPVDESNLGGEQVADEIGMDCDQVFKTLVIKGNGKNIYVFCIPVNQELDLKKAAKVVGEKKIELLPMKDLLVTTGYIRGGCTPIGMKKKLPTFVHETLVAFDVVAVSAGVRGCQLLLHPDDLVSFVKAEVRDLTME